MLPAELLEAARPGRAFEVRQEIARCPPLPRRRRSFRGASASRPSRRACLRVASGRGPAGSSSDAGSGPGGPAACTRLPPGGPMPRNLHHLPAHYGPLPQPRREQEPRRHRCLRVAGLRPPGCRPSDRRSCPAAATTPPGVAPGSPTMSPPQQPMGPQTVPQPAPMPPGMPSQQDIETAAAVMEKALEIVVDDEASHEAVKAAVRDMLLPGPRHLPRPLEAGHQEGPGRGPRDGRPADRSRDRRAPDEGRQSLGDRR